VVEHGQGPRSGARDNGLRAARYVAVGDFDPRIADAAMHSLREEGIAAYVSPTPGQRGGYLELRLPHQPTDRLYVDEERAAVACDLLAGDGADATTEQLLSEPASTGEPPRPAGPVPGAGEDPHGPSAADIDVNAAWEQVLLSLRSTDSAGHPWPDSEDVERPAEGNTADVVAALAGETRVPDEPDEHFVPPAPPPLPRLQVPTVISLLAILAGILVNVTGFDGGDLDWLGVFAVIGGAIGLVWRAKDGPPNDSGWDDGAVV
jgi:hypothetical protein